MKLLGELLTRESGKVDTAALSVVAIVAGPEVGLTTTQTVCLAAVGIALIVARAVVDRAKA